MNRSGMAMGLLFATLTTPAAVAQVRSIARTGLRLTFQLEAPQGVTATTTPQGVQIAWQQVADAAIYEVIRSPDTTNGYWNVIIGGVHAPVSNVTDRYPARGAYRVTAVAADGRRSASQWVPWPAGPAFRGTRSVTTAFAKSFPQITGFLSQNGQSAVPVSAVNGETLTILGTALGGSAISLVPAQRRTDGSFVASGTAIPVSAKPATGGVSIVLPAVPVPANQYAAYFVAAAAAIVDTSDVPILIGRAAVVRKITSVERMVIRSGLRFRIHGIGFDEVIGGYVGSGVPGSVSNPMLSMWNRQPTYVELATPVTCDQEGPVMLEVPVPTGSPIWVSGDQPIVLACVPQTPSGAVAGTEASPQTPLRVPPGSTVSITGRHLKWVTEVIDQRNASLPFRYQAGVNGFGSLIVTLPNVPNTPYGFYLRNLLTDPVVDGTVTGYVVTTP